MNLHGTERTKHMVNAILGPTGRKLLEAAVRERDRESGLVLADWLEDAKVDAPGFREGNLAGLLDGLQALPGLATAVRDYRMRLVKFLWKLRLPPSDWDLFGAPHAAMAELIPYHRLHAQAFHFPLSFRGPEGMLVNAEDWNGQWWRPTQREDAEDVIGRISAPVGARNARTYQRACVTTTHCRLLIGRGMLHLDVPPDVGWLVDKVRLTLWDDLLAARLKGGAK